MKKMKWILAILLLSLVGCEKDKTINVQENKEKFEEKGYTLKTSEVSKTSYYLIIEREANSEDVNHFQIYFSINEENKEDIKILEIIYLDSSWIDYDNYEITRIKYSYSNFETARFISYGIKENGNVEKSCVYYTNEDQEKENNETCNEESGISQNEIKKKLEKTEKSMDKSLEEIGITREEFKKWLLAYINNSVDKLD